MTNAPPEFYDSLALTLAHIRAMLEEGVTNRRSSAHAPVVASIGEQGTPEQRVMILRAFDWEGRTLRFNTDKRSAKVAQIEVFPSGSVLFYDPLSKVQLRLKGEMLIEHGSSAASAWEQSTPFARRCYMADRAPSSVAEAPTSGLPSWIEGVLPEEHQLIEARANFAILKVTFSELDWLYLANTGHRRARYSWRESGWQGEWLVP